MHARKEETTLRFPSGRRGQETKKVSRIFAHICYLLDTNRRLYRVGNPAFGPYRDVVRWMARSISPFIVLDMAYDNSYDDDDNNDDDENR